MKFDPPQTLTIDPEGTYVQTSGRFGPVVRTGRSHKAPGRSRAYRGDWQASGYMPVALTNRRWFAWVSIYWKNFLTAAERTAWKNYALAHPVTTEPYSPKTLTGFGMFKHINKISQPYVFGVGQTPDSPLVVPPQKLAPASYSPPVYPTPTLIATSNLHSYPRQYSLFCAAMPSGTSRQVLVYCAPPGTPGGRRPKPLIQVGLAAVNHPSLVTPLYQHAYDFYSFPREAENLHCGFRPIDVATHVPGALVLFDLVVGDYNPVDYQ